LDALPFFRFSSQPAPSTDLRRILGRQAAWDDSGQDNLNPSGLQMRFDKIDEQPAPGGRVAGRYRVYVPGAPENKVFAFDSWPLDKDLFPDPRDIYVNGQGLLMIRRPRPEQDSSFKVADGELEITLVTESAEPVRFLFSSKDSQLEVYGTLVPHPLVSDEQGCRLEVRIAQPGTASVLVIASGLPAKSKIPLVLQSEDATTTEMLSTDSSGHAVVAGIPSVPGRAQGTFKATVEGPGCLPSVVLPWTATTATAPHAAPEKTRKH
jgi:hypothetical protein